MTENRIIEDHEPLLVAVSLPPMLRSELLANEDEERQHRIHQQASEELI